LTGYIYDFILVPTEELHPELDFAGLFGQTVADLVEGVHTLIIPKQDYNQKEDFAIKQPFSSHGITKY
jgi:hypothetical protein